MLLRSSLFLRFKATTRTFASCPRRSKPALSLLQQTTPATFAGHHMYTVLPLNVQVHWGTPGSMNVRQFASLSDGTIFNDMVEQLKQYKKERGHCHVPMNCKENKQLRVWVTKQRRVKHKLSSNQIEELDSIGFIWDKVKALEAQWDETFDRLKKYKEANGDCLVPSRYQEDTTLGNWVKQQRNKYNTEKLSKDRTKKLESIGFVWDAKPDSDAQWNKCFDRFKKYKEANGDCLVPIKYQEDTTLGNWVRRQRNKYKMKKLSKDRTKKLESIGFVWDAKPDYDAQWNKCFDRLKKYKEAKGDCLVPSSHNKDTTLGNWVRLQRNKYNTEKLSKDRTKKLESIGFVWDAKPDSDAEWNKCFDRFKKYKEANGDCLVPIRYQEDRTLGNWVRRQRNKYKMKKLSKDRTKELESIGFVWDAKPDYDAQWNKCFDRLKKYKETKGDCLVPSRHKEDTTLGNWVKEQRKKYNTEKLSKDRTKKLESIGFVWDAKPDSDAEWNKCFDRFKKYKEANGDCLVPIRYQEDRTLGNWVRRQRNKYKMKKLSKDRTKKLESIGFVWDASTCRKKD